MTHDFLDECSLFKLLTWLHRTLETQTLECADTTFNYIQTIVERFGYSIADSTTIKNENALLLFDATEIPKAFILSRTEYYGARFIYNTITQHYYNNI